MDEGEPAVVPDADGNLTIPSVVALDAAGQLVTGLAARDQAGSNPTHTFAHVKRIIGRSLDQIKPDLPRLSYVVEDDHEGGVRLHTDRSSEGFLYPEEVSGAILSALVDQVADAYGQRPTKAVVGVPAYFDDDQREATIQVTKEKSENVVLCAMHHAPCTKHHAP